MLETEELGLILERCPLSEATDALDLAGDGILEVCALEAEEGATLFLPSARSEDVLLLAGHGE